MELTGLTNTCGALTSNGTPCRRYTIRGGTRCSVHGGGSPQARRVAEEMLAIARVPAARVLVRIIEDYEADSCATCGRPTGDAGPVIRAAFGVLDRTGLHPSMSLQVARAEPNPLAELSEDDLIAQLEEMLESARAARDAKQERRLESTSTYLEAPHVVNAERDFAPQAHVDEEVL